MPPSIYTFTVDGKSTTGTGSVISLQVAPAVAPVPTPTPPPPPDDITLAFFGDELFNSNGVDLPSKVAAYNPAFGHCKGMLNQGDGGSSASWWVSGQKMHFGRTGVGNIQAAAAAAAGGKLAIFNLGMNDARIAANQTTVAQYKAACVRLAGWAKVEGMTSVFIGTPIVNLQVYKGTAWDANSNVLIQGYNDALASMAASFSIGYIPDVAAFAAANPGYYPDGVNPTSNAWPKIAALVADGIARFLGIVNPGLAPPKLANPKPLAIGLNVTLAGEYSSNRPWVNAFHGFSAFRTPDNSAPVALSPEGYPLADCQTFFIPYGTDGVYRLSYAGNATVGVSGCGNFLASGVGADGHKWVDCSITKDPKNLKDWAFRLLFKVPDPANPPRDFKLIAPDALDVGNVFTPWFIAQLQPHAVLRCMEPLATNNNTQKEWADRVPPTRVQQCSQYVGCSHETLIALSKEARKPLWINFFSEQSDDAIQKQAEFYRDNYPKDLPLYLEWSNELWLYSNWQYGWRIQAGRKNPLVMSDPATVDGTTHNYSGNYVISARQAGFDAVRCSKILASVFGAEYGQRVKFVAPGSGGWTGLMLDFVDKNYGPPARYFDALETGFYQDCGSEVDQDSPTLTADQLLTSLETHLAADARLDLTTSRDLAKQYGLPLYGYEGGPGLSNPNRTDQAPYDLAASDPRMKAITHGIFDQAQRVGMDLAFFYKGPADAKNRYSWWQLLNAWDQPTSPKLEGVLQSIKDFGGTIQ